MRLGEASRTDGIMIGELSRLTGVHIETIRYYERIKMLPKPPRTVGGHRTYGSTHVRLLAFIKRSRELGFSPDDVRTLLRLGAREGTVPPSSRYYDRSPQRRSGKDHRPS
jgi:MerR family transcriptional regulator, mercuric resistance operon regulatory protein